MWLLAVLWVYAYVTGSTKSQPASPQSNPPMAWVSLYLVVASFLLYAPSLTIGLLSDDFVLVDRITTGAFWSLQKAEFFRPAPHLLWAAIFEIVGHQALYLHILNVLIHAINSSLVVVIATRLGFDRLLAILAGVLFLTIPSNVEPVAWASGIQDVLMTMGCRLVFVVGASRGPSLSVMFSALSGLVVGLLTKETAVMAPVLASVLWHRVGPFRKTPGWAVIAGGVVLSRRRSGRPGSLLTLAPHRSGRAGSAASGSSTDGFATRAGAYPLAVQGARGATHPHAGWPVRLSVGVSLRRNPTSVCWPSFPPTGPPAGAPFPPRGLVGSIPPLQR